MAAKVTIGFTDDDLWVVGSTRRLTIPIVNTDGTTKDLTGASAVDFRLTDISAIEGTPTVLITKALGSGAVVASPATDGNVVVTIAPADTASLTPGDYSFEVKVIDGASDVESVTLGTARLQGSLFAA